MCIKIGRATIKKQPGKLRDRSTHSGHGTMVDFTVFIAIASTTTPWWPSNRGG
jgi:hypothetical protein